MNDPSDKNFDDDRDEQGDAMRAVYGETLAKLYQKAPGFVLHVLSNVLVNDMGTRAEDAYDPEAWPFEEDAKGPTAFAEEVLVSAAVLEMVEMREYSDGDESGPGDDHWVEYSIEDERAFTIICDGLRKWVESHLPKADAPAPALTDDQKTIGALRAEVTRLSNIIEHGKAQADYLRQSAEQMMGILTGDYP